MKKIIYFFGLLSFLTSCEGTGEEAENQLGTTINTNVAVLKYSGTLAPTSGISGSGTVKIYQQNNRYILKLENYTIENGPDLKVYLSKANEPSDFINLGAVTSGTTFTIPAQVTLADYPFALIHCQQYNHLYAVAALEEN